MHAHVGQPPLPRTVAHLRLATLVFGEGEDLLTAAPTPPGVIAVIKSDGFYLREVRRRAALPAGAAFLRVGRLTTGSGLTSSTGAACSPTAM